MHSLSECYQLYRASHEYNHNKLIYNDIDIFLYSVPRIVLARKTELRVDFIECSCY